MTWRKTRDLAERGWVVAADGGPLRPGCLLRRVQAERQASEPLPLGPEAASVATTSHGDGLGGTAYSSDHATATNPQGVWYLKHLLARDAWLFRLSVLDNLPVEGVG